MGKLLPAVACVLLLARAVWSADASADRPHAERGPSAETDLPQAAQNAIQAGVAFLARAQNPDGSWLTDGPTGRYPAAMTALAGLALLEGGSTCYSGEHADGVRRAVHYLVQQADPATGLIGGQEAGRPMFGRPSR